MTRPTIAELEKILLGDKQDITIMPDGELRVIDRDLSAKIRELEDVVRAALNRIHHDDDCMKVLARGEGKRCTCGAEDWRNAAVDALGEKL